MLRVYSIMYLENVWTRPSTPDKSKNLQQGMATKGFLVKQNLIQPQQDSVSQTSGEVSAQENIQATEQNRQDRQERQQISRESEDSALLIQNVSKTLAETVNDNEQIIVTLVAEPLINFELTETVPIGDGLNKQPVSELLLVEAVLSSSIISESNKPQLESKTAHLYTSPNGSVNIEDNTSATVLNIKTTSQTDRQTEREFYDDDISLEDEDQLSSSTHMSSPLKTPPATPLLSSSKFSPKRILQRAKSTIQQEVSGTGKGLGRRTSLFLEKISPVNNHKDVPLPPLPSIILKENLIDSNKTVSNTESGFSFNKSVIRRQSSKLTKKSKNLSNKLKKALSFHQLQAQL